LEITHNISETVQDKDIVPMEDQQEIVCGFIDWQQYQWSSVTSKVNYAVLNLSNSQNSGVIACINYDMYTHELESERGLYFQLSYQNW